MEHCRTFRQQCDMPDAPCSTASIPYYEGGQWVEEQLSGFCTKSAFGLAFPVSGLTNGRGLGHCDLFCHSPADRGGLSLLFLVGDSACLVKLDIDVYRLLRSSIYSLGWEPFDTLLKRETSFFSGRTRNGFGISCCSAIDILLCCRESRR